MIADRRHLASQIMELRERLGELSGWTDNPDSPFPGDAVAVAEELRRVAELLVAGDNESSLAVVEWRTSLVAQGFGRAGQEVPVTIGLAETMAGGVHCALRVGEQGEPVIFPLEEMNRLATNARDVAAQTLKTVDSDWAGDQ